MGLGEPGAAPAPRTVPGSVAQRVLVCHCGQEVDAAIARTWGAHEGFADREGTDTVSASACRILARVDAVLGHDHTALRYLR